VFEKSDLERVVEEMCLSLRFLKKNLMREGQLLFVIEDEEEEEKKKVPRMMMESNQQRKIEEKFSFRVLPKKKGPHTQNFCLHLASSQQERTTKRALEGVRVCVCVCVDLESKQHIHTQKERNGAKLVVWRRRPRRE